MTLLKVLHMDPEFIHRQIYRGTILRPLSQLSSSPHGFPRLFGVESIPRSDVTIYDTGACRYP